MMILNLSDLMTYHDLPSRLSWQNWTWHIWQVLKNRAKLMLSSLPVSGTPCPRHIIVPFGAEAPSGHAAQAWAIPPPSWGLLSQWQYGTDNRQQRQRRTERPPPEPSDILKRFYALYDIERRYFMKKVSKLYYLFNSLLHMLPIGNMWFQLKLKNNSCNRGL